MREPSSVFTCLLLPSEEYKVMFWKKKYFEDFEDFLVSFRLYFVSVEVSSYISTMYCLLL
jgi:hypothetical protein